MFKDGGFGPRFFEPEFLKNVSRLVETEGAGNEIEYPADVQCAIDQYRYGSACSG
jgi:hypothetical protein